MSENLYQPDEEIETPVAEELSEIEAEESLQKDAAISFRIELKPVDREWSFVDGYKQQLPAVIKVQSSSFILRST